jgi:hypothetical protein
VRRCRKGREEVWGGHGTAATDEGRGDLAAVEASDVLDHYSIRAALAYERGLVVLLLLERDHYTTNKSV